MNLYVYVNPMTEKAKHNTMWGGRFEAGPSEIMESLNASIDFDKKLFRQDIAGSIAHTPMLNACDILTAKEAEVIIDGLQEIEAEIASEVFQFSAAL